MASASEAIDVNAEEEEDDDTSKYSNCNLLPTHVSDFPWLYEINELYDNQVPYTAGIGKWMVFVPFQQIDALWQAAKGLYNAGELPGILSMKVSTMYQNPRASGSSKVLILYCGPVENREHVMNCGKAVVRKLVPNDYDAPYLYFKSDAQTEKGTRATGQQKNWLYRLKISENK